jgi:hypothetical protein
MPAGEDRDGSLGAGLFSLSAASLLRPAAWSATCEVCHRSTPGVPIPHTEPYASRARTTLPWTSVKRKSRRLLDGGGRLGMGVRGGFGSGYCTSG